MEGATNEINLPLQNVRSSKNMSQRKRKKNESEVKLDEEVSLERENKKHRYEDERKSQLLRLSESLALSSAPSQLVGRLNERSEITSFLEIHLQERSPGGMYISGSPGTGKTALLMEIIRSRNDVRTLYINCMELSNRNAVFDSIARGLQLQRSKKPADSVRAFLCKKHSRMM